MRLASLFLACLCSIAVYASDFADISHADLVSAIAAKSVTIIDVNGTDSWTEGHIPGAIDFNGCKELSACLPTDKSALIVAYCGGPACGAWKHGATAAAALGYTNVKHYSAGISGWKEAHGELEKAKKGCCKKKAAEPKAP